MSEEQKNKIHSPYLLSELIFSSFSEIVNDKDLAKKCSVLCLEYIIKSTPIGLQSDLGMGISIDDAAAVSKFMAEKAISLIENNY